jgi:hypothetical protein
MSDIRITAVLEGPHSLFLAGWRHYLYLNDRGAVVGTAMGQPHSMRREYGARAVNFYPAGQWEQGFDPSGKVIIKPEVLTRATGTQQGAFPLPCQ